MVLSLPHGTSNEEVISMIRQQHFIGIFKVMLPQTENHPNQRALDNAWVDQLVQLIVVLEDELSGQLEELVKGSPVVPILLDNVVVQVFSGQHQLAMLSCIGLESSDLWWHAEVYKKELETKHPAEFLTMMHESNTPQVMKVASDVELFQAVHKLKGFLHSGRIRQQTFLQNRRMLLQGEERTSQAITSLTRNDKLANAIANALLREHIAREFAAGSWMRLTTGRLYMVAAGLVAKMTVQVDQLMEGMVEIPHDVLSLQPRTCLVSKLELATSGGKKKTHPWDQLPGKRAGALHTLNPKKAEPWSLPHIVLLPTCLGSKFVEDELKMMQTASQHLLKMILSKDQFVWFLKGYFESVKDPNDHPAGLIAGFITEKHGTESAQKNGGGFELKIMHMLWKSRAQLLQELKDKKVPDIDSSGEADYQRLLTESEVWWNLMRQFKVQKLQSRYNGLSVPKEFGATNQEDQLETPVEDEETASPSKANHASKRLREHHGEGGRHKRAKGATSTFERVDEGNSHEETSDHAENPGTLDDNHADTPTPTEDDEDEVEYRHENAMETKGPGEETSVGERRGGDCRLTKALDRLACASNSMTQGESRVMTDLLEQIMESRESGDMGWLVLVLVQKGKTMVGKMEKRRNAGYESATEEATGQNSQTTMEDE